MAVDSGMRQGTEQGSAECRAAGNQRGRAAAVDSGVQGHVRSRARRQVRLRQRRHRQWAACLGEPQGSREAGQWGYQQWAAQARSGGARQERRAREL